MLRLKSMYTISISTFNAQTSKISLKQINKKKKKKKKKKNTKNTNKQTQFCQARRAVEMILEKAHGT